MIIRRHLPSVQVRWITQIAYKSVCTDAGFEEENCTPIRYSRINGLFIAQSSQRIKKRENNCCHNRNETLSNLHVCREKFILYISSDDSFIEVNKLSTDLQSGKYRFSET